jgi:hypothetical protein
MPVLATATRAVVDIARVIERHEAAFGNAARKAVSRCQHMGGVESGAGMVHRHGFDPLLVPCLTHGRQNGFLLRRTVRRFDTPPLRHTL